MSQLEMTTVEDEKTELVAAVPAPAQRPVAAALRLLRWEVGLTFRRPRNIAMLAVLAIVPVLIGVTLRIATRGPAGNGVISLIAGNGLMLTFFAFFVMVPLILPLAVSVVAGDAIAGEASIG